MWSLYFVILDFLNEQLPWRNCRDNKADDVRDVKTRCLADPAKYLWCTTTSWMTEVQNIFYSINKLQYADKPDYGYIRRQLLSLLQREEAKEQSLRSIDSRTASTVKRTWAIIMSRRNGKDRARRMSLRRRRSRHTSWLLK